MFKPATRLTLHDNVLAQLLDGIRIGQWKPGECLPGEKILAQQFHVSRNCIREVLKALALANIVEARPGIGTFLTENALQYIDGPQLASTTFGNPSLWELKEVRDLIEGYAAFLAAKRATPEQLKQLGKYLNEHNDNSSLSHYNFHTMLVVICGNRLLLQIYNSVKKGLAQMREKFEKLPNNILTAYSDEHYEIYELICQHKPEKARDMMLKHIENSWTDTLYDDMQGKNEKNAQ